MDPAIYLELQTCFTRGFCQRLDAPVIEISATVKYHFFNSFFLRPLRDRLADLLRAGHVAAGLFPGLLSAGAGRSQRLAGSIIYKLNINMVKRTVHVQPRTLRRTGKLVAQTLMHPPADFVFRTIWNHFFSAFAS